MIETLYRTSTHLSDKSERYVLVLTSRAGSGRQRYAFMEEHGTWDEEAQRLSIRPVSIHADENLTWDAANALYQASRARIAAKGFGHSIVHKHPVRPVYQACKSAPEAVLV